MFKRKKQSRQSSTRHLITHLNPRSPISEQYRTLRTNLQFSAIDQTLQTILVTSSGPGEGKSITIANLAVTYAQQSKKVLLIDADMRKPTVHYTFRLENIRGLSNLLIDELNIDDVVNHSSIENLNVITCGPIPPNPAELLGSKRMERIVEEAKEKYDIILFDTPPVLAVTDAQILTNIVDGALLVIRSGETEHAAALKAKESLDQAKGKLLGIVLNDQQKNQTDNYYYYYSH